MAVYRRGKEIPNIERKGRSVAELYRRGGLVFKKIKDWLSLTPRFARISPGGANCRVMVNASTPWKILQTEYPWHDGTGEILKVEYTGNAGESEIILRTSQNTSGFREIEIPVYTERGRLLGRLTVSQSDIDSTNAYDRAYSNGYNLYSGEVFLEVKPEHLSLAESPAGSSQMQITTNPTTNWGIEISH